VIEGLEEITTKHENEIRVFRKALENNKDAIDATDKLNTEDIFPLVGTLYRLPINGKQIRQQVDSLKVTEEIAVEKMEKCVKLPKKARSSRIMRTLKEDTSSEDSRHEILTFRDYSNIHN
jgi:hypothetical protein